MKGFYKMTILKEKRRRNIEMKVRFKPEEYSQVRKAMEQMGTKNFQYYAKNQLVQGKLVQIDFSELKNSKYCTKKIIKNCIQKLNIKNVQFLP